MYEYVRSYAEKHQLFENIVFNTFVLSLEGKNVLWFALFFLNKNHLKNILVMKNQSLKLLKVMIDSGK